MSKSTKTQNHQLLITSSKLFPFVRTIFGSFVSIIELSITTNKWPKHAFSTAGVDMDSLNGVVLQRRVL